MKRLWILIPFLMVLELAWGQFYSGISPEKRKELAEAYYLVGSHYRNVGQNTKGKTFQDLAFQIYPQLDPGQIKDEELPSAAALILAGRSKIVGPAEDVEIEALIRSRFLLLISALITEDVPGTLELLDGSVYISKFQKELGQAEIEKELKALYAGASLLGLAPSEVYDLDSLSVEKVSSAPAAWGSTYSVRIRAKKDFSKDVVIWEDNQRFLIHQTDRDWLIFSIGQDPPPAGWAPRKAPAPARGAVLPGAGPSAEIRGNFQKCLEAFLRKDTDEAVRFFSRSVQILRLNVTLSREEIGSTFQGYFEASDFTGVKEGDLVVPESIFIEESPKLSEAHKSPAYLLTVKTRLDLSEKIPFWTRFQEYYFIQEEGVWRIFAIF